MATTLYNTSQVAEKFDTTTRTLRKFLRSPEGMDSKVGKGQRWTIEAKKVQSLQKRFNAWLAATSKPAAADATVEVIDEVVANENA